MPIQVAMPKWGLTMKQGKLVRWLKKEGEAVKKGEDLFEVETEKITNKAQASATGVLFQILVQPGTTVPTGSVLAILAEPGEKPERLSGPVAGAGPIAGPAEEVLPKPGETKAAPYVPATPVARRLAKEIGIDLSEVRGTGPEGRVTEADVTRFREESPPEPKATPLAREMARQAGLDLALVQGTGERGKITKEDVERALAPPKPEAPARGVRSVPFSGMRRIIAENMQASLHNAAQLTVFAEVDVSDTVRFRDLVREEYRGREDVKVSLNDIVVLATSRVLKRFPIMNSTLVGEEILLHDAVHMGVAVALPEGLIVPVLRDADQKGLLQIAREARELARKAREGGLTVDEVTGGTFTITNVSMFQVDGFTPILRAPETGILGLGRVKEKPAVHDGQIAIRSMMFLSLTFDHQVVDGAPANEFLQTVARYLEHPTLLSV
ncbi:MAG: 2-oxo acid dehydrogenase subunit E2 [Deltaproteobacteria bacterium]|nr:2-oxo acid dehydrogenase subunit E2 [Deltaproteobacteria bacterium]